MNVRLSQMGRTMRRHVMSKKTGDIGGLRAFFVDEGLAERKGGRER